jgi:hypothetical protein
MKIKYKNPFVMEDLLDLFNKLDIEDRIKVGIQIISEYCNETKIDCAKCLFTNKYICKLDNPPCDWDLQNIFHELEK